ncbi:hypothetical protein, partial [Asanoa sp. NPDC050611]|uniref:hypothetical protein n=1 Tax=Asanoa sp. NPDC050611 TaxID=3157098 RepID=UPI0033F7AE53
GARVVAAASAALPERRVEVTVVPTTLDLVVFTRCGDGGSTASVNSQVTVNGHLLTEGACTGAARWGADTWPDYGVAPGRPATFVLTVTDTATDLPAAGDVALAVGQGVPFDEYPLPPRPAGSLAPLPPAAAGAVVLASDPDDPTRSVRRSLTWQDIDSIHMRSQTPGLLHVRVSGVQIATGEWWDYQAGGYGTYGNGKPGFGVSARPGEQVTVEVTPEHVTGAWQVVLQPAKTGS